MGGSVEDLLDPYPQQNVEDYERVRKVTKAQMNLDKVMRDIDKIKSNKNELKDRKLLVDELKKVKDE